MVGTSDIPDWCYVETFGSQGISSFTEAPSSEHLAAFYSKSPIAHISKVYFCFFRLNLDFFLLVCVCVCVLIMVWAKNINAGCL